MTSHPFYALMSSGEISILLVYRFQRVFQFNISTCKTFWTPLVCLCVLVCLSLSFCVCLCPCIFLFVSLSV